MEIDNKLFEARANIAKALAHPTRIAILDVLKDQGELCVWEIYKTLDLKQSVVSKHLNILKRAGIIESRKVGLEVHYSIHIPCVATFFNCINQILEKDIELKS